MKFEPQRPCSFSPSVKRAWLPAALLPLGMTLFAVAVPGLASAQDGSTDTRWRAARASEQELIQRQIVQLRLRISKLVPRFEADGRPEAAALLRKAIELLDERPEDAEAWLTLARLHAAQNAHALAEQALARVLALGHAVSNGFATTKLDLVAVAASAQRVVSFYFHQ